MWSSKGRKEHGGRDIECLALDVLTVTRQWNRGGAECTVWEIPLGNDVDDDDDDDLFFCGP